jgi:hypothetical protein
MANTQGSQITINQIRADRACIGCGFNLFGQTVTKEEHYGLAIARCPECGTVAALQSYPTMSHWVNRFRVILASFWIILLTALFAANTGGMIGFTVSAVDVASDDFGDIIGLAYEQWGLLQEEVNTPANVLAGTPATPSAPISAPGTTTIVTINGVTTINGVAIGGNSYRWQQVSEEWIEEELETTIDQTGGLWKNADKQFLYLAFPAAVIATIAGILWSILLLGAKRKQVLLVPLAGCLIAGFLITGVNSSVGSSNYSNQIADWLYTPLIMPMLLGTQFIFLAFGIFIGRKVARMLVVMALPVSARVPFSIFWTRDGLQVPNP